MKGLFQPSLRKKLVYLLLVAYVLPVVIMISMLSIFITEQYDHQVIDKVELSLKETTELTTYYLSSMMEDSRRPSNEGEIERAYRRYLEGAEAEDLFLLVESSLNRSYRENSLFHSAAFFYDAQELSPYFLVNSGAEMQKAIPRIYQELYPDFQEISADLGTQIGFYAHQNRLYMVRNLLDSQFDLCGILVLEVNVGRILDVFQGITGLCQVDILFDEALVESAPLRQGEEILVLTQEQRIENHSIAVSLWVDIDQGHEVLETLQNEITQVLLLLVPAIGFMLFAFYRHVTRPLQTLMEAQLRIQKGDLGYQVGKIPHTLELRAVTQGFNTMSQSMKDQFEQSYKEQLALQDAKMRTLQSQINPHFLNNTLEIINWETRIGGNTNATAMLESLSVMLRATMDRQGKGKISLEEELTYVDAYLYIQSCRMGNRLQIERNISEESLAYYVPRLAFQPLVENACEHGVGSQKQGRIVLSSYLSKETLILEVKNTGTMSENTQKNIASLLEWDEKEQNYVSDAPNVGIRNVNQRVKMMYGMAYGMDMFNDNQGMTVLRLALPKDIP